MRMAAIFLNNLENKDLKSFILKRIKICISYLVMTKYVTDDGNASNHDGPERKKNVNKSSLSAASHVAPPPYQFLKTTILTPFLVVSQL